VRIVYVLFAIGLAAGSSAQSLEDETVSRLAEYLRIDTINPPGNESNAVDFFAKLLDAEGIAYESAESAPGRAETSGPGSKAATSQTPASSRPFRPASPTATF